MSTVPDASRVVNRETFADRLYRMASFEAEYQGGHLLPGQDVILLHDSDQEPVAEGDTFPFAQQDQPEYLLRVAMVSGPANAQQLVRLVAEEVPS